MPPTARRTHGGDRSTPPASPPARGALGVHLAGLTGAGTVLWWTPSPAGTEPMGLAISAVRAAGLAAVAGTLLVLAVAAAGHGLRWRPLAGADRLLWPGLRRALRTAALGGAVATALPLLPAAATPPATAGSAVTSTTPTTHPSAPGAPTLRRLDASPGTPPLLALVDHRPLEGAGPTTPATAPPPPAPTPDPAPSTSGGGRARGPAPTTTAAPPTRAPSPTDDADGHRHDPRPTPLPTTTTAPAATADTPPPRPPDRPADAPATRDARWLAPWVIEPGQHLWAVAEATLATHTPGEQATVDRVARYHRRLLAANAATLPVPDDPDLVFPGTVVHRPAPEP